MWGISTRKTTIGWQVNRVHYSADADKDPRTAQGAAWLQSAKTGISDARWRKEFEIDYGALGGQLCFPKFEESIHVVAPFIRDPKEWTVYMACDPHPRTAHAFVYLAVNRYGEMTVPFSWWPEALNREHRLVTVDYADKLKDIAGAELGLDPDYALMDVAGRNFNADEHTDYFKKYESCGVTFQRAKRDLQEVGIDLINEALALKEWDDGVLRPTLTIQDGCGDNEELIQQIKSLRFREHKGLVTDKDAPEEPEQKRRHLVDGLIYILLAEPQHFYKRANQSTFKAICAATAY